MGRKKSLETKELEERIERYFEKCELSKLVLE